MSKAEKKEVRLVDGRKVLSKDDFEKQLKVVLENRHIHCPFYDACLDRVIAERWENWTCKNCPGNARRKEGDEG